MFELAIILLVLALAVVYLVRRYARTFKQAQEPANGCGDSCGCCSPAAGDDKSGSESEPSPFKLVEKND